MAFAGSSEFLDATQQAFGRLVTTHGFDLPVFDDLGREVFVHYHKGNYTVSVAMECGAHPIIELFYPSAETGESPVAWAQRNGVERSRRIPRLRGLSWDRPPIEVQLERALASLEVVEIDFLRRP